MGEPDRHGASLPRSSTGDHYRWPPDVIPSGEATDRDRTAPWGEEAAMPSSMIFVGLVVLWLLILVPAVARHRQEVVRPSVAALSGRVLERPRRSRSLEVDVMDVTESRTVATRVEDEEPLVPAARSAPDDDDGARYADDDRDWERPPPRYRPGRGGFDPDAAALTARARYAFRQRVVLALLVAALISGVVAGVALPVLWWAHVAVDVTLVGYLVYLRRQVRMEEAIRGRRAARMAGTRRPPVADDPELDGWARRGREESVRAESDDRVDDEGVVEEPEEDVPGDDELALEEPERVPGTGASLKDATELSDPVEEIALPRLQPVPPLALPAGTSLVTVDEDDPDLHDLDGPSRPDYRRAVGE
jgi:hypothetical protein